MFYYFGCVIKADKGSLFFYSKGCCKPEKVEKTGILGLKGKPYKIILTFPDFCCTLATRVVSFYEEGFAKTRRPWNRVDLDLKQICITLYFKLSIYYVFTFNSLR